MCSNLLHLCGLEHVEHIIFSLTMPSLVVFTLHALENRPETDSIVTTITVVTVSRV